MKTRLSRALLVVPVCLVSISAVGRIAPAAAGVTASVPSLDAAATAPAAPARPETPAVSPAAPVSFLNVVSVAAAKEAGLSPDVLKLAVGAVSCAVQSGAMEAPATLTVIDYSRPSIEPRLWVYDLTNGELLYRELVAHGRNTGEAMATRFSDQMESRQSSIGLFRTEGTYVGSNGYSLRLDGLEPGFNGRARDRAIVMHGAPYVDASLAAKQGRIGRSWGCPAVRPAVARQLIDRIQGGGAIFSYYPDQNWLNGSRFLAGCDSSARVAD